MLLHMLFDKNFLFGVATAAYQIEGAVDEDGRGKTIWDTFCETPGKIARGESGKIANDHYHRWKSDVAIMKELGVNSYRFSMAWSRMFPDGKLNSRNQKGFDFYNNLIDELLVNGIKPIVTLFHWDLPQALQDEGGWANRQTTYHFADYATEAAKAYGDRVEMFAPINEPWVHSWLGHGLGYHAPGIANFDIAIAASHHTVLAHNLANRAIKAINLNLKVGPVQSQSNADVDDIFDEKQIYAAEVFNMNQNTFWMDAFFKGEYPDLAWKLYDDKLSSVVKDGDLEIQKNDFLGVNYYFNTRIGHEVSANHPNRVRVVDELTGLNMLSTSMGEVTDMGWSITPYGLEDLLVRWTKLYPDLPPIYITENGAAYDDDLQPDGKVHDKRRIEYLNDHLLAVLSAIDRGADVRGYMQWSMMDNFEWAVGYAKRFGIVHVNYETQKRTIKDSGIWYRNTIKSLGANLVTKFVDFA